MQIGEIIPGKSMLLSLKLKIRRVNNLLSQLTYLVFRCDLCVMTLDENLFCLLALKKKSIHEVPQ